MSKQHHILLVYFIHLGEKFKSKPRKKYKLKSRLIKRKQFHVQGKKKGLDVYLLSQKAASVLAYKQYSYYPK